MCKLGLVKISFLSAVNTFFRLISSFISIKIIAVLVGPSGLALIGQLQNSISMCQALSAGALRNGVIKYSAEYIEQPVKTSLLLSTSLIFCTFSSVILSLFLMLFSNQISEHLFNGIEYVWVVFAFAICFPLFSINQIILAFLNGVGAIYSYIICGIANSIVAIFFLIVATYYFNIEGAFFYYATWQSIVVIYSFYFLFNAIKKNGVSIRFSIDNKITKNLLSYAGMALLMAITVPGTALIIRSNFLHEYGSLSTGYLQAIWRLSDLILLFVTTTLSVYFLPKFSSITDKILLKNKVYLGVLFTSTISLLGLGLFFILRDWLIPFILSVDFLPVSEYLSFQFLGGFVKAICWVFGTLLLAKGEFKFAIFTEILLSLSYLCISYFLLDQGIVGITKAYFISNVIYLIVLLYWFKRYVNDA